MTTTFYEDVVEKRDKLHTGKQLVDTKNRRGGKT